MFSMNELHTETSRVVYLLDILEVLQFSFKGRVCEGLRGRILEVGNRRWGFPLAALCKIIHCKATPSCALLKNISALHEKQLLALY